MTQNRIGATREHRGHPPPHLRDPPMADRVDPTMDEMETLRLQPPSDRSASETQPNQLPASDDAMLSLRDLGDSRVGRATSRILSTTWMSNIRFAGHRSILAASV